MSTGCQAKMKKALTHQIHRKLQYITMLWLMLTRRRLFRREPPRPECPVNRFQRRNVKTSWNRLSCWQKLGQCRGPCSTLTTTSWIGLMTAATKRLRITMSQLRSMICHFLTTPHPYSKSDAQWPPSTCLSALIASMADHVNNRNKNLYPF